MREGVQEPLHQLTFEARASALAGLRRQLADVLVRAGCSASEIQSIVIAVNEACTNIIRHAYHGDSSETILMLVDVSDDRVLFELLDHATPIDLASVCSQSIGELRPGGLGLSFINQLMQDVRYSHRTDETGNRLRMTWERNN